MRGLVLVSGYYHPTVRADALLVAPAAVPVLGDVLRHTVSPLFGAATLPLLLKGMFAPLPVPERFEQGFPHGMAVAAVCRSAPRPRTAPAWPARRRRCATIMASCACRW